MSLNVSSTPPVDAVMPALPQTVLIVLFGILIAAALVHALILIRRDGDHRLLVMLGCGAAASLLEGFACHLIQCWHSAVGMVEVYESFDIHVPLWLAELYVLFFGAMPYYFFKYFAKSPTPGFFWGFALIVGVIEGIAEMVCIRLGIHAYWGTQPLAIFGFPLYLGFINPILALATSLIGALWFQAVQGVRRYLLIVLTPPVMAALYGGLTYPTSGFLHDGNAGLMVIGSIGSMILSLVLGVFTYQGLVSYLRRL